MKRVVEYIIKVDEEYYNKKTMFSFAMAFSFPIFKKLFAMQNRLKIRHNPKIKSVFLSCV